MGNSLWEKVCDIATLSQAWQKIAGNMGAGGIDKVSIKDFEFNQSENLNILSRLLLDNQYRPLPSVKFYARKHSGGRRVLGIPAVRDRIVQQAVVMVMSPSFERIFLNCSYAYRPRKSAQRAVNKVEKYTKKGFNWVVDADIDSFFDNIDHHLLIKAIQAEINDSSLINLIDIIISSEAKPGKGLLQGAVTSPLFSNIYIHSFDFAITDAGYKMIRYADDFLIFCKTEHDAGAALSFAQAQLQSIILSLNKVKTTIASLEKGFIFLGYEFNSQGKRPNKKALSSLMGKIYKEAKLSTSDSKQVSSQLKSIISGWRGYFKLDTDSREDLIARLKLKSSNEPDYINSRLALAALYITQDKYSAAKQIIGQRSTLKSGDSNIHTQWGCLCVELDLLKESADEFLAALRVDAENKEAAYNLALVYLKEGNLDKCITYLQQTIHLDYQFAPAYYALGKAYEKYGLNGLAKKYYNQAVSIESGFTGPDLKILPNESDDEVKPKNIKDDDIHLYLKLFAGREGIYAKQWLHNGRIGYFPVKEPLTTAVIKAHLCFDITVGVYLMREDNTVKMMIIDVDADKSARKKSLNKLDNVRLNEKITDFTARLTAVYEKLNIPVYIEDSGCKGRHFWTFFSQPIAAGQARELCKNILTEAGKVDEGLNCEIFPKQNKVGANGLGSLIKLPLGIHRATERRCLFIDKTGKPIDNQFAYLAGINTIDNKQVKRSILDIKELSAPKALNEPVPLPVKKIIEGCAVIGYLNNKAESEHDLTHVERLILLYSIGHLGDDGKRYLHQIMSNCLNYNYKITQKWIVRLQTNFHPISCPKIRDWLSHITPAIGCGCRFNLPDGGYPTPNLYADSKTVLKESIIKNNQARHADNIKFIDNGAHSFASAVSGAKIDNLLQTYIGLKNQRQFLNSEIIKYESKINDLFDKQSNESLSTKFGLLKRVKTGNEIAWIIEI